MNEFPVLGIDPGFANIGYSTVMLSSDGKMRPVNMGVFRTDKSDAKRSVFASEDNLRRAREIYVFLKDVLRNGPCGPVRAVCAETMSYPRNSSAAAKVAMCWGVLAAISEEFDIPVLQATPQGLKLKVQGKKTASKVQVQEALEKLFGKKTLAELLVDVTPSFWEHPVDALGAVVACGDSEVLRLARRMSV